MRVPDRQKQRREYLKRLNRVHVKKEVWRQLLWTAGFFMILCGVIALKSSMDSIIWDGNHLIIAMIFAILACVSGVLLRASNNFYKKACREEETLPYVPPFLPDKLPAEEVLVRGSQEPTHEQSTVLLRAAEYKYVNPEQLLSA